MSWNLYWPVKSVQSAGADDVWWKPSLCFVGGRGMPGHEHTQQRIGGWIHHALSFSLSHEVASTLGLRTSSLSVMIFHCIPGPVVLGRTRRVARTPLSSPLQGQKRKGATFGCSPEKGCRHLLLYKRHSSVEADGKRGRNPDQCGVHDIEPAPPTRVKRRGSLLRNCGAVARGEDELALQVLCTPFVTIPHIQCIICRPSPSFQRHGA